MKTIYLLKGSYQYEYDDPIEIVEEYYYFEQNAYDRAEGLHDECAIAHLDIEAIDCDEYEIGDYYLEDEDEIEEDEDEELQ